MPFVHSVKFTPNSFVPYIMTRREVGQEIARDVILVLNGPRGLEVGTLFEGHEWDFIPMSQDVAVSQAICLSDQIARAEAMR